MRLLLLITGWMALAGLTAQAQRYAADNYRPTAPGAYSFFKYIDNPVDLYHGLPTIEVPLYPLKVGGKTFPLALTYHAGGIRLTEEASWVGLGWDFTLPTVVQTINDEDDFAPLNSPQNGIQGRMRPDWPAPLTSQLPYPRRYVAFSGNSASNNTGAGWSATYPPTGGLTPPATNHPFRLCYDYYLPVNLDFTTRQEQLFTGRVDSEPDVFKINLFGKIITCLFDFTTRECKVLNNPLYAVQGDATGWLVIDPDGYRYSFADRRIQTVTSSDYNGWSSSSAVNTPSIALWSLVSITSPQNQRVEFAYTESDPRSTVDYKQKYQRPTFLSSLHPNNGVGNQYEQLAYATRVPRDASFESELPMYVYPSRSITHETKRYIHTISSDYATITFFSNSYRRDLVNASQLDSIVVQDPAKTQVLDRYTLTHGYFLADSLHPAAKVFDSSAESGVSYQDNHYRLKLTGLRVAGTGDYSFAYHPQALPPRNCLAQDYWGYYNGAYDNQTLIPNPTRLKAVSSTPSVPALADNGNNNSARLPYALAGMLTSITYPTGGSKTYEYELNTFRSKTAVAQDYSWVPDYDSLDNKISKGNGLRIKRITSVAAAAAAPLITEYTYLPGQTMQALRFYRYFRLPVFLFSYPAVASNDEVDTYQIDELKENALFTPGLLGSGSGIGYSQVQERHLTSETGSTPVAGTTVYYYANKPDSNVESENSEIYYTGESFTGLPNFSVPGSQHPTATQNGLVDSVLSYNATGQLLQRQIFRYQNFRSLLSYGVKIFSAGLIYQPRSDSQGNIEWIGYARNLLGFYPLFDKTSLKIAETTIQYGPAGDSFTQRTTYTVDGNYRITAKTDANFRRSAGGKAIYGPGVRYTYLYAGQRGFQSDIPLLTANRTQEPLTIEETHRVDSLAGPSVPGNSYRVVKKYRQHPSGVVLDSVRETFYYPADASTRTRLSSFPVYDNLGRSQQAKSGADVPVARLWHDQLPLVLAEAKNVRVAQLHYTSFEPGAGAGWATLPAAVVVGGVTGKFCLPLTSSLLLPPFAAAGTYQLTYWAKKAVPQLQLASGSVGISLPRVLATRSDGWTCYQATLNPSGTGGQVRFVASATSLLDEVRLYPSGAQMSSYTYGPWQNVTSQTDATGRLTTYEYDAVGRLLRTRDEQGRILAQHQYHYAGH